MTTVGVDDPVEEHAEEHPQPDEAGEEGEELCECVSTALFYDRAPGSKLIAFVVGEKYLDIPSTRVFFEPPWWLWGERWFAIEFVSVVYDVGCRLFVKVVLFEGVRRQHVMQQLLQQRW